MKDMTPMVSVLMPVYNGMPYLPLAVESILKQTFTDFEFIIVNDCSTDSSIEYLQSLQDTRIVLVDLPRNLGVTGALQAGMKRVRGKYVARLDADDIAKPHRLQTQVNYMEHNPEIGLLGCSIEQIDSSGKVLKHINLSKDDLEIRWRMLFKNSFFHSTVIFRHSLILEHRLNYRLKYGEDYQLWVEMLQFCKGTISSDELIQYRKHQQSWTFNKSKQQLDSQLQTGVNQIKNLTQANDDTIKILIEWVRFNKVSNADLVITKKLFIDLVNSFIMQHRSIITKIFLIDKLNFLRRRDGFFSLFNFRLLLIYRCLLFQK